MTGRRLSAKPSALQERGLAQQPTPLLQQLPHGAEGVSVAVISEPRHTFDDLVLATRIRNVFRQIAFEHQHHAELARHDLRPANRVLLSGPPGTGKTSCAGALAKEIGATFLVSRQHALINDYMGTSERYIASLLEHARLNRAIYLIDEIDGLASKRDSDKGGGLGKTYNLIVTAILAGLDRHGVDGLGLIVACTNRIDAIDPAVRRRFDIEIEFPMPDHEEAALIARRIMGEFGTDFPVPHGSQADIVTACRTEKKRLVLTALGMTTATFTGKDS